MKALPWKKWNWKKKLANWMIGIAYTLDKIHLEKCTIDLTCPQATFKSYVKEDGLWHKIEFFYSFWLYAGKKHKGKEELYIDGKHVLTNNLNGGRPHSRVENAIIKKIKS